MGIDLDLIPVDDLEVAFGHSLLALPRDPDLFAEIRDLPSRCIPSRFCAMAARVPSGRNKGERMYGPITDDAYGDPLQMVRAGDLARVFTTMRRAWPALAYLKSLAPETFVVLYWH